MQDNVTGNLCGRVVVQGVKMMPEESHNKAACISLVETTRVRMLIGQRA